MLNLDPQQIQIVKEIIGQVIPKQHVLVFGSRVTPKFKPHSDLDLCVLGDSALSLEKLTNLRDAFAESALPMRVDIIDWASITPEFRSIIRANCIQLV